MPQCFVDGRATGFDVAVVRAAEMIAASRRPVIAGCGTDVAGARAVVRLADAVGAVVDHMHADAALRDLDVMREHGVMLTTPNEARRRADVVLLVGGGLEAAGLADVLPDLGQPSLAPLTDAVPAQRVVRLRDREGASSGTVADAPLAGLLQMLRARVSGHGLAGGGSPPPDIETIVEALRGARFGVAVWAPGALDPLALEMLCGLVKDLNAGTRWSGLSLPPGDDAVGVLQTCAWMSGFPMRTSFARGYPEHDPWLYDAARMVGAGETDCVVWISAFRPHLPAFAGAVPLIVLQPDTRETTTAARVAITVGRPGIDHDAVVYDGRLGGMVPIPASAETTAPSVAMTLDAIAAAVRGVGAC